MARYLERRERDVEILRDALSGLDFDTIRLTGHNLSGSGAAYGLDEISRLGRQIEDAANHRDTESIRRHLTTLAEFVRTVRLG